MTAMEANGLAEAPLIVAASHEQKMKYLPDTCSGAKIGGMGMSEPAVGTDVLGMTVCF